MYCIHYNHPADIPVCQENTYSCLPREYIYVFVLQIITSIPTHKLPKNIFTWGSSPPADGGHDTPDGEEDEQDDHTSGRGQILWVRGLTRLQQQVKLLSNFVFLGSLA